MFSLVANSLEYDYEYDDPTMELGVDTPTPTPTHDLNPVDQKVQDVSSSQFDTPNQESLVGSPLFDSLEHRTLIRTEELSGGSSFDSSLEPDPLSMDPVLSRNPKEARFSADCFETPPHKGMEGSHPPPLEKKYPFTAIRKERAECAGRSSQEYAERMSKIIFRDIVAAKVLALTDPTQHEKLKERGISIGSTEEVIAGFAGSTGIGDSVNNLLGITPEALDKTQDHPIAKIMEEALVLAFGTMSDKITSSYHRAVGVDDKKRSDTELEVDGDEKLLSASRRKKVGMVTPFFRVIDRFLGSYDSAYRECEAHFKEKDPKWKLSGTLSPRDSDAYHEKFIDCMNAAGQTHPLGAGGGKGFKRSLEVYWVYLARAITSHLLDDIFDGIEDDGGGALQLLKKIFRETDPEDLGKTGESLKRAKDDLEKNKLTVIRILSDIVLASLLNNLSENLLDPVSLKGRIGDVLEKNASKLDKELKDIRKGLVQPLPPEPSEPVSQRPSDNPDFDDSLGRSVMALVERFIPLVTSVRQGVDRFSKGGDSIDRITTAVRDAVGDGLVKSMDSHPGNWVNGLFEALNQSGFEEDAEGNTVEYLKPAYMSDSMWEALSPEAKKTQGEHWRKTCQEPERYDQEQERYADQVKTDFPSQTHSLIKNIARRVMVVEAASPQMSRIKERCMQHETEATGVAKVVWQVFNRVIFNQFTETVGAVFSVIVGKVRDLVAYGFAEFWAPSLSTKVEELLNNPAFNTWLIIQVLETAIVELGLLGEDELNEMHLALKEEILAREKHYAQEEAQKKGSDKKVPPRHNEMPYSPALQSARKVQLVGTES